MQNIIEIHAGTEAFTKLKEMMLRAELADSRVSLTYGSRGGVQLKCGGGTWTTPLKASPDRPARGEVCSDPQCPCS